MYVFNQLKLVEQRGKGMSVLKMIFDEFNLPLPRYSYENPYLKISLFRTIDILSELIGLENFNQLNEEERIGLLYIYNVREITKSNYAEYFKIEDKKAQRQLSKFKKLGLVNSEGATSNLKYIFIK